MSDTAATTAEPLKSKKNRSPAYPFIPLAKAVVRAKEFWAKESRHAARIAVAVTAWGFESKSSGGLLTVAALKQFGLMSDFGNGGDRQVQLTPDAIKIILDERQDSPERDAILKTAAIKPTIHAELWKKWAAELPSDENIRTYLKLDKEFTETAAASVLKEYKETLKYAKLIESGTISSPSSESEDTSEDLEKIQMQEQQERQPSASLLKPPVVARGGIVTRTFTTGTDTMDAAITITSREGEILPDDITFLKEYVDFLEKSWSRRRPAQAAPAAVPVTTSQPPPPAATSAATVASVQFMITRQMEADLLAAGYSQEQINVMTPQQARENLAKRST